MARHCEICGKHPSTGHSVSHANNKTKRRWIPNLQRVRVLVEGRVRRLRVCTSCIHAGRVRKAPYNHSGAKISRTAEAASS